MLRRAGILATAALGMAAVAQAATQLPEGFAALRAKDERVARIGYELATGNAAYCNDVTPAIGLLLHDLGAYGKRDEMRAALGLKGDIAIQAVVPGSPAAEAGLTPDMALSSIAGLDAAGMVLDRKKRWERLETIRVTISETLKASGALPLQTFGSSAQSLQGVPACTSRFEVGPVGKRAVADGNRVVIGDKFPGHEWNDDLLAGVIAHELAHNILEHRKWLDANGRKRKWVRVTEQEADRLAPWLLANAGYDPDAAARFLEVYQPATGSVFFVKGTHPRWQDRAAVVEAEAAKVRAQIKDGGKADWRTHFVREALPDRDS